MTFKQAIVVALIFGFTAALVVWYLERFEINKFHGEVQHYMNNQSAFQEFLKAREGTSE